MRQQFAGSEREVGLRGEVDAIVIDHSHAETFMKNANTRFHVIPSPLAEERLGIATHHAVISERAP